MDTRGVIFHRSRARQINDFSGLRYGTITPTDIDGLIDFGGKLFVLFEIKYGQNEMPFGQQLAIERVVDAIAAGGLTCYGMLARHFVDNCDQDVDAAEAIVTKIRHKGRWIDPRVSRTLRETIDMVRAQKASAAKPKPAMRPVLPRLVIEPVGPGVQLPLFGGAVEVATANGYCGRG